MWFKITTVRRMEHRAPVVETEKLFTWQLQSIREKYWWYCRPEVQLTVCFCMAQKLNSYYLVQWLERIKRKVMFHDTWKAYVIQISVSINTVLPGHSHIHSFSFVYGWFRIFVGSRSLMPWCSLSHTSSVASGDKVYYDIFVLRTKIEIFLNQKNHSQSLFLNPEWLKISLSCRLYSFLMNLT